MMLSCIAAVAVATFVGKKTLDSNESNGLLAQNVQALSNGEFPDGWAQNFTMSTVWYRITSDLKVEVSYTKPIGIFGTTWQSMSCCVNSVDSNACNFNNENGECKNKVTRNAH